MVEANIISVTETSAVEPVTLAEAKGWLGGLDGVTEFDTLIGGMIKGARQSIEKFTNRALVPTAVELDLCVTGTKDWNQYKLPYAGTPSDVVVSELDDTDNPTEVMAGENYFLRGNLLRLSNGRYTVTYEIDPGNIPEALKEAIKCEVAERFRNRGENNKDSVSSEGGLSQAAKEKAQPYIVIWL